MLLPQHKRRKLKNSHKASHQVQKADHKEQRNCERAREVCGKKNGNEILSVEDQLTALEDDYETKKRQFTNNLEEKKQTQTLLLGKVDYHRRLAQKGERHFDATLGCDS